MQVPYSISDYIQLLNIGYFQLYSLAYKYVRAEYTL